MDQQRSVDQQWNPGGKIVFENVAHRDFLLELLSNPGINIPVSMCEQVADVKRALRNSEIKEISDER